jgi:hypothetical protein
MDVFIVAPNLIKIIILLHITCWWTSLWQTWGKFSMGRGSINHFLTNS